MFSCLINEKQSKCLLSMENKLHSEILKVLGPICQYKRVLMYDFDLSWWVPIHRDENTRLMSLASPTLLLMCRLFSAQSSSVFCLVRLMASLLLYTIRLYFNHVMWLKLQKMSVLDSNKDPCSLCFCCYVMLLLLVLQKLLKQIDILQWKLIVKFLSFPINL